MTEVYTDSCESFCWVTQPGGGTEDLWHRRSKTYFAFICRILDLPSEIYFNASCFLPFDLVFRQHQGGSGHEVTKVSLFCDQTRALWQYSIRVKAFALNATDLIHSTPYGPLNITWVIPEHRFKREIWALLGVPPNSMLLIIKRNRSEKGQCKVQKRYSALQSLLSF